MNKTPRIIIVGAMLFLMIAGVALANNLITCDGGTCEGTDAKDTMVASNSAETVIGKGGDDDIELDVSFCRAATTSAGVVGAGTASTAAAVRI